ncbi:MAG: hypothetical protein IIC73_02620 [Armatimonadetes bacterium]|nr:hypothetical protein [Armatimonadota bacterium]
MDASEFREMAIAAFPPDGPPSEVVSDLARDVHHDASLIEAVLKGRPWTAVPQSVLEERAKDIVALTVPAFVHYLPAVHNEAQQHEDDSGGDPDEREHRTKRARRHAASLRRDVVT